MLVQSTIIGSTCTPCDAKTSSSASSAGGCGLHEVPETNRLIAGTNALLSTLYLDAGRDRRCSSSSSASELSASSSSDGFCIKVAPLTQSDCRLPTFSLNAASMSLTTDSNVSWLRSSYISSSSSSDLGVT